jgi:hypothetical protein
LSGGAKKEQEVATSILNTSPIERAFELARSGQCSTTADVIKRLKDEGYTADKVIGPVLMKQLRDLIDDAASGAHQGE